MHARSTPAPIDYADCAFPIREDLTAAHGRYWRRLAAPGAWLSGTERVDVAREVRAASKCSLCLRRKEALSPHAMDGAHDGASDLPAALVDVIHRVTTDPGRLTEAWFDTVMAQGVAPAQYVEVVGTVAHVFSIDEFCRGLDLAPHALPVPEAGEPSRYVPSNLGDYGAWVQMLPPAVESGQEADIWNGSAGAVIRALSLVPDEVRSLQDLGAAHYLGLENIWNMARSPKGTLSRIQSETIASRVSSLNGCFY